MIRKSNVPILLALLVGAAAGWAGATGRSETIVSADQRITPASSDLTAQPYSEPVGAICAGIEKTAAASAILAHNTKVTAHTQQAGKKPNILVIWGDDIGTTNLSCYSDGLMGYETPNIDRIARLRFLPG